MGDELNTLFCFVGNRKYSLRNDISCNEIFGNDGFIAPAKKLNPGARGMLDLTNENPARGSRVLHQSNQSLAVGMRNEQPPSMKFLEHAHFGPDEVRGSIETKDHAKVDQSAVMTLPTLNNPE